MKKITAIATITACLFLTVCDNTVHGKRGGGGMEQVTEGPITITWKGDIEEGVQSFQTNVQIYSMNNRTDTYAALNQTYRLSMSTINNRMLTRIDFDSDTGTSLRSFISDGEEFIAFNPDTNEVGYRIQIEDSQSPLNRIFGNQSILSRVNLSLIREEARRLSLSMREETEGNSRTLLLELPPGLLPQLRVRRQFAYQVRKHSRVIRLRQIPVADKVNISPYFRAYHRQSARHSLHHRHRQPLPP
jgi:hypothetical protein